MNTKTIIHILLPITMLAALACDDANPPADESACQAQPRSELLEHEELAEDESLVCQSPSAELGQAIFTNGTCVSPGGVALADCRTSSSLYRSCDAAFEGWCNSQGGALLEAPAASLPQTEASCGIGPGAVACDLGFFAGCEGEGKVATCDDPSTCVSATCHSPGPQEGSWCCEADGGPKGAIKCIPGIPPCASGQILLNCVGGETAKPNADKYDVDCH